MERGWLHRVRWRRRGAWLWPLFIATAVADAVIGHFRPVTGDSESVAAAAISGVALNLLGVLLLSRPLGALLRRARGDLPGFVARNYAGSAVVLSVTAALLALGLVHHASVLSDQAAMREATVRAQAWIGARAPAEFRRDVLLSNTFAIQPGTLYRTCVPSDRSGRSYCVIVKTRVPFGRSVSFDGYEPNWMFAQGVS